jgi:hypothetical protein
VSGDAGGLAEPQLLELGYSTPNVFSDFLSRCGFTHSAGEGLHRVLERATTAAQLEDASGGLIHPEDLATLGVHEEERILLLLDDDTGRCSWKDQGALSW